MPQVQNSVSGFYNPQPLSQNLNLFPVTPVQAPTLTIDFTKPSLARSTTFVKEISNDVMCKKGFSISAAMLTSGNWSSTFVLSITDDMSVYNSKCGSSSMFFSPASPLSLPESLHYLGIGVGSTHSLITTSTSVSTFSTIQPSPPQ
ncbi:WRKY DNA-binding protein 11 [Forsythia ovata]|uniref:WRKY DNA-binding protein 11 n=1 Tax=Forsythia ovata TaxID=205694 RepID=A0ABD1RLU4_9LAMI